MSKKEYTGGSVSYYRVKVVKPTNPDLPAYEAECNDIIEALNMTYAEGNAFKAIWRSCAARTLGLSKEGYKDGLYDAQKVEFFGKRMVVQALGGADAEHNQSVVSEATPVNDGWIEWYGGKCPVPKLAKVHVKWSDGRVYKKTEAGFWRWDHDCDLPKIVAYRLS